MMNPNQLPPGAEGTEPGSMPILSPIHICRQLLRLANSKSPSATVDSGIESVMQLIRDGYYQDKLPKEILAAFQGPELESMLRNHNETDVTLIFVFFRNIFNTDKQGLATLAMELFGNVWKFSQFFQMKIVEYAIRSDNFSQMMVSFPGMPLTRRIVNIDQLKSPPEEGDPQVRPWVYQSLYDLLVQLSEDQSTHSSLEEVFFIPFNKCPDLLILGLIECEKHTRMKDVVLKKTFTRYLFPQTTHVNVAQVFSKVWPAEPTPGTSTHYQRLLLTAMVELYTYAGAEEKSQKLSRILDLAQDLKALNLLLGTNSSVFALDLACLASRREYLKLDKWIKDQIQTSNGPQVQTFVESCLEFIKKRCSLFSQQTPSCITFPNETFGIIIQSLRQSFAEPKCMYEQEILIMYNHYVQRANALQSSMPFANRAITEQQSGDEHGQFKTVFRQMSGTHTSDHFTDFHHYNIEYPKEVEDESDVFFQKIYNPDQADALTVDQMLETLKKFQESSIPKERQIYLCIIRNLFKEFPYLEGYPEKELIISGEMFGGIILYDFVKGNIFVSALKTVLDSLKRGPSKYFFFGQAALNKFKTRLREFPQYCTHLSSLHSIRELPPSIVDFIQYGKEGQTPPNQVAIAARKTSSQVTTATTNAAAANEDFGEHKPAAEVLIEVPPSSFQEKIAFIINNLTKITLTKKVEDFKDLFSKEKSNYWPWVAQYLVSKRVGLEINYHDIYSKFLTHLQVREFSRLVLAETYRIIRSLLRSNKEVDSFSDRTLLKNLGQWLGLITLQKNVPILAIDLDPKCLLIEAYHNGEIQTMYVVPFVTKILTGITKECVFALPNPWTLQIIYVLTEFHSQPDIKLNMKFEVEVLFKAMEISIEDYKPPTPILKNSEIFSKIELQLGNSNNVPQVEENLSAPRNPGTLVSANQSFAAPNAPVVSKFGDMDTSLGNITTVLSIKRYPLIESNPGIEALIKAVFEKTVQEWAVHIAERMISVPLGTIDTLIKRSFQSIQEPNPEYIRIAGENFVKTIVASYALVNTKEHIMTRIQQLLSNLFQKNIKNSTKDSAEYLATQLINDNIEMCVYFIEKFCIERSIEEWNKRFAADFANFDFESIKNKPRVVTAKQMQFFEEMAKNSPTFYIPPPTSNPAVVSAPIEANRQKTPMMEVQQFHPPQHAQEALPDTMRLVALFDKAIVNYAEIMKELEYSRLSTEQIQNILEYLRSLKSNFRDQKVASNTVKVILLGCRYFIANIPELSQYENHPMIRARDICVLLLKSFFEARILPPNAVAGSITRFFTENCMHKEQSYPDHLFEYFYKQHMINLTLMDSDFATLLDSGCDHRAVSSILGFLKYYLMDQSLDIPLQQFPLTNSSLKEIMAKIRATNPKHMYMNDILSILSGFQRYEARSQQQQPQQVVAAPQPDMSNSDTLEKATYCIREWLARFAVAKQSNLQDFSETVKTLSAAGFLKTEESVCNFFRIFLELVVEKSHHLFKTASKQAKIQMIELHMKMFECIDPFSALAIIFIKETGKNGNLEQKLSLFSRLLHVIGNTALREESAKETDFSPWAYYRIILYLFSEMYVPVNLSLPSVLEPEHHHLMESIAIYVTEKFVAVLRLISPSNLVSFAFAWIDIISHKSVMVKFLSNSSRINVKTWPLYFSLLIELLNFLRPYWTVWGVQADEIARQLYTAQLKIFNLIRVEYPDFLCEFGFQLIQHVPFVSYLMQTRNIILSSVPSSMARLDLASQIENANMQELNEMAQNQRNPTLNTQFHQTRMKPQVEQCLSGNSEIKNVVADLMLNFQSRDKGSNSQLLNNSQLIFGLLLFVGQHACQNMKVFNIKTVRESPYFEFFLELFSHVDSQARYVFFAWMVDHLRYPCKDTLFYVSLILALYPQSKEMGEQISRAVIERELAYQPHPWGLQLVISELNKHFKIFSEEYLRMVPNLEKSFTTIYKSNLEAQKNSASSPAPGFNPVIGNERD